MLSVPVTAKKKTVSFDVSSMKQNRSDHYHAPEVSEKRYRKTKSIGGGGRGSLSSIEESGRQLMEWWNQKERAKKWQFEVGGESCMYFVL